MAKEAPNYTQKLREMKPDAFVSLGRVLPSGALYAYKRAGDEVTFFWRTTTDRVALGRYDPKAHHLASEPTESGLSIYAARQAAERAARKQVDQEVKAVAVEVALAQEFKGAVRTVAQLCDDYVDYLENRGADAREVRSCFRLHVKLTRPDLAALPANQLQVKDITDLMILCKAKGKIRQPNKLRSYLRAAYELAAKAEGNPNTPVKFRDYKVAANPVANVAVFIQEAGNVDKNPLSNAELREYWHYLQKMPKSRAGLILQIHLLTGGQRIAQLARLKTADIHEGYFEILDGKGKPGHPPRRHTVAITPRIQELLDEVAKLNSTDPLGRTVKTPTREFAFSSNGGRLPLTAKTISDWAHEEMEGKIHAFELKRLRSTLATLMKKALVPYIVRADVQSHGVKGVMSRHYEAERLLPEKRWCLSMIETFLEGKGDTPMRWPVDSKVQDEE